ncbi:hypothetical protein FQN50_001274 [Emmonsiellopsis sp. PD_5]|nr:hypothetical protein FQN50_001274 [Emmonsiellopsis sp. PD_5]
MRLFLSVAALSFLQPLIAASALPETPRLAKRLDDYTNNVVFQPGADYTSWRTIYGRSLQLPDDSLLTTWENYPPEPPQMAFPIYKSTDYGLTWSEFSRVEDTVNGWGLRYQPTLYALPQDFGGYPAGTILLSSASVPVDLSQAYIDLYASQDGGLTWEFVSHIAYGAGPETIRDGNDAIWEPFFLMHEGQLICYYSDQRDPLHAQKLLHVTTSDLRTWSEPVDDVAHAEFGNRPGMAIVAHIESTNKYIMTYEICGPPGCVVNYKVSDSPLTFGSAPDTPLVVGDVVPYGSPYVIWTPHPDRTDGSGLIIMNGSNREEVFVNEDAADPNGWRMVNVGQWSAYSRQLNIINVEGERKLMITNGGNMGDGSLNYVVCGVVGIPT